MKDTNCIGSNNAVVAATTSSSSSSSSSQLSLPPFSLSSTLSSSSSSSSLNVAGAASSSALRSGSAVEEEEEDCGVACWQRRGVRDLHSSSDTDDCDLDLGVGRLVIDLEADPDARARCPSAIEMKSSSGQQQKSISNSSGTLPGIHGTTTPVGSNSAMETIVHPGRGLKTMSVSENSAKPSHRSLAKSIGSSSGFLPMTTALGDLGDKGIKMRIKCNQSGPNSASSVSTMKHEILPYHTPFIPSNSSSSENALTSAAEDPSLLVTKTSNERSSYGSGSLSNRSNCNRSLHKKERHSTKDRTKATNPARTFGEDVTLASAALSSSSPSSSSTQLGSSSAKECIDVAAKMDVASTDSDGGKASASSHDPYEFNMKTEDIVRLPVKKIKLEKWDAASSPFVDHLLPELELKDAEVDACHIGVITEPECLGPCDPGTSVTLEGIVWNETENGLLVVNVTWRGKTYVGTLMDSTKHHWAPPRFSGDSPTSDFETRTPKGRGKRGRTCAVAQRNEGNGSDRKLRSNRSNKPSATVAAPSPVRNDACSLKRSRTETASSDGSRGSKCSRSDSRTSDVGNVTVGICGDLANGGLIECPEENCSKKYRNLNGLRYHQTRVHRSTCASLAKDMQDVQTSKYINDDFVENSVAEAERFVWKTKPNSAECSQSRRTAQNTHKPMDNEMKLQEALEEIESQSKPTVNEVAIKEEGLKEKEAGHGKTSFEAEPKPEDSPEPVCMNAVNDASNEHDKGTSVIASGKGTNNFSPTNADESKKLGTNNHPLTPLIPVSVPARVMDDSISSAVCQLSSASAGSLGALATELLGLPTASLPPGNASSDDAKSHASNDQSKSDGDRGKKSKSEKLERSKVKLQGGCMPRPVVPPVSASSSTGLTKTVLLSPGPLMMLQTVPAQQLKPIQPKPLLLTEQAHMNLVALTDKSKKRKREREKPKEQPLLPVGTKPVAVNKPGFGSENPETTQRQNAAVPLPSASPQTDCAESAIGQDILAAAVPVSSSSTSSDGFGPIQLSSSDSAVSASQPDLAPVTAHCSPALCTLPRFPMHPTASEQLVPTQTASNARPSDSSSTATQSNIQTTLPPPSPVNQHRLHLPVENMNLRPVVVSLQSPLSAMKAVPSSVIKNTSGFEISSNCDLPSKPKSQPVADTDLPNQPLSTERKVPILPNTSDFIVKPNESSSKSAHDGLHPASSTNPPLNSPCKKSKNSAAKHADSGSNLTDFGNPHSPAYSDISDANDNAPMLDAPMLEKEAQAAAEEEEVIGSKVSPSHPQDSYVYSPFYGQPPYLTPAVSSSDIPDCGSVLKPSLSKPPSDKHQTLDKVKAEAGGGEKRLVADSVPLRSRPAAETPLKFPGDQQLREQPLREDKDTREKGSRVVPAPGPVRADVHKSQHQQQQQQQQQQHKMFSGEAMLPQQAAMMQHVIMPPYGFSAQFGYYSQEYSEMQRLFQIQQQQQQEARRHDQPNVSKGLSDSAGDHSKTRQTGKVPAEGKPLPTPPSLIPDRNRHDLKEEADRNREKQLENRKLSKDGIEVKNLTDVGGSKSEGGYDMKTLVERPDLQRYHCIQPHFLEQQQQQRLNEHQSHKSMLESGVGGCKPSAVVAPQARDKNTSSVAGIVGNTPLMHSSKQSSREDAQGRGHEGHRSHRDSQKNPSMTPPQQHAMQSKSSAGTSRDGSSGRVQKDAGERSNAKEDSGPSSSRGVVSKGKDEAPMTSLPVSMPAGIPAPYAPYYGHYLPPTPYGGAMPFDPTHAPLYQGMMGYAPAPYIHPAQMLSPALAMASADVKPCDILAPTQPPAFFSNEGQAHKIHELKEVAKMQQGADGSQPSPGSRDPSRPKSSGGGGSHSLGKDSEHSSPPTQRHVHTHHHMHVVGLPYRFVGDAAIIASQQAAAATDATQIPRPFLK